MDYNLDYSIYRNRFINNKYLSQNRINLIKPTFIFSPFKKRARSHERPFNLINKYYNDNFILEEDNEEETNNMENSKDIKIKNNQEKENNNNNLYKNDNKNNFI